MREGNVSRQARHSKEQASWGWVNIIASRRRQFGGVSKRFVFGIVGPATKYVPISAYSCVPKPVSKSKSQNLVDASSFETFKWGIVERLAARKLR